MSAVTRSTPAGAAYLELQRQARQNGRLTAELLQLYALEGFLARLEASPARDQFVLKGGVLLAAFVTAAPPVTSTYPGSTSKTMPPRF